MNTYPTAARLAVERRLDLDVAADLVSAERLRAALAAALVAARATSFRITGPCAGYDIEDIVGLLTDMMPLPVAEYAALLEREMADLLRQVEADEADDVADARFQAWRDEAA